MSLYKLYYDHLMGKCVFEESLNRNIFNIKFSITENKYQQ